VSRLALEVEGWLELRCPDRALVKVEGLLAVPAARPVALLFRIRACVELGHYEDALKDLEEIRSFDHDAEWADMTEAWCRKRVGDLQGAADCMVRLLGRASQNAIGHFNLACYLALMGETKRALDEVSLACGIDPTLRGSLDQEEDLVSLHGNPSFECLKDRPGM
jgi:tetratricopeptide (TPR) repeat protein